MKKLNLLILSIITFVLIALLFYKCKKEENKYNIVGNWVCENNVEFQGELEFKSDTYTLFITYLFQDSISGTIDENGSYSYTSTYNDPDNLFSSGYYSGTITFNSGDRTYSVAYSYGNDESFAFWNYKIDPKITIGSMWWAR